jgi:para-nitrobenzyl esterase
LAEDSVDQRDDRPLYLRGAVQLENGLVAGAAAPENEEISTFKGLPFAKPPVGERRWRAPEPPESWDGVRDATKFAPSCPQDSGGDIAMFGLPDDAPKSEDCLYLDVWTGAQTGAERRPVMVWFCGGGFYIGASSQPMYNGVCLAESGAVVVLVNYRVNVLGGFAHPALSAESGHGASGNYALMDQSASLRWVRDNIAAFGGDPDNVTIFGESAGSRSVALHLISPLSRGLFHRGICQSGGLRNVNGSLATREDMGLEIAAKLGCDKAADPLAALRAQSWESLAGALDFDSNPFVDGWVVPDDPQSLYEAGDVAAAQMIVGVNGNEGGLFTRNYAESFASVEKINAVWAHAHGDKAEAVAALYPADGDGAAFDAMTAYEGDIRYAAPARNLARLLVDAGVPVYFYHFTHTPPWRVGRALGAHHGAELAYIFGGGVRCGQFKYDGYKAQSDRTLSLAMRAYWANFAATGDPNQAGSPHWPCYDRQGGAYIDFGEEPTVRDGFGVAALDKLEAVLA